jgi:hypothetical protein
MKYEVCGEYGPQGGMTIDMIVDAESEQEAITLFCVQTALDHPSEWARMGRRNVRAWLKTEPLPKATPMAIEVTQTMWRVCFAHRSDMIVTATTLLDVADHVRGVCEDTGIPLKDVVKIEYLAY